MHLTHYNASHSRMPPLTLLQRLPAETHSLQHLPAETHTTMRLAHSTMPPLTLRCLASVSRWSNPLYNASLQCLPDVALEQLPLRCIPTVPPREHLPAEPHSATHCCSASPLRSPREPQMSPSGSETNPPEGHHATHKTICHEIQARNEKYLDGVVVTSPRIKSACLKNTCFAMQIKSKTRKRHASQAKFPVPRVASQAGGRRGRPWSKTFICSKK